MTYRITAIVGISVSTLVEAANEREALYIAEGRDLQSLPYDNSSDDTKEWCHCGELDGMPTDLKVEVAE